MTKPNRSAATPPRPVLLLLLAGALAACSSTNDGQGDDGGALETDAALTTHDGSQGVDGGVIETDATLTPDAGPESPSAFLFDNIHDYEVEIAEEDWQWLRTNALDETYVPATVRFQGETYSAAICYKGGGTLSTTCFDESGQICKVSMKVSFNEYDDEGRFFGLKKILFHSMLRDPTLMHDSLSYQLFEDMGLPSPRTSYARLTINGQYLGLFAFIEYVDGRFARRVFSDGGEGNLYKAAWPTDAAAVTESYFLDRLRTNKDEDPSAARMLRFSNELREAGTAGVSQVLRDWQVEDQLMRYMAVARMVDHWDDIGAWLCLGEAPCTNKNYYWYASTESDQVWFIPWDMDHTLEPASRNRPRNNNVPEWDDVDAGCELVEFRTGRYYRPPACDTLIGGMATGSRELYVAYSNELLNGPFSVESMNARIDALETLLMPYILEDPYEDVDAWQEALTELRSTVVAKREFVQRRL